ncbi:MAG: L,D-transpeptidase [Rhizobium sp.]|nr:L,D-transpeptidase [Rhizobium sp.]
MIRKSVLLACALALSAVSSQAAERYKVVRPVIIESGIAGEWMTQLGGPVRAQVVRRVERQPVVQYRKVKRRGLFDAQPVQQVAYRAEKPAYDKIDPKYLPQVVDYDTRYKPGTIVIDTVNRFLYLVMADGKARRYGVGVGKPGFEWAGEHKVTRKAEWPDWHPPKEMIAREAAKGHYLPAHMPGGEANPLGARAMYLGSTLYRIHGTNAPWTIGYGVSSGCIRMRNQDVVDLYERVKVGARVIVI